MGTNETESTMDKNLFINAMESYQEYLILSEYSSQTVKKYVNDIKLFLRFVGEREQFNKYNIIAYKSYLLSKYKISSVNSYIISLNKYFGWMERSDLKVKTNKIQRKTCLDKVISKEEYIRILDYLKKEGKKRDYLLIRTLALTGIRIGELKFITYEAVISGEAQVDFKGKSRSIYIVGTLSEQLLTYCQEESITEGIIFHGRSKAKSLDSSGIWKRMKRIAVRAGVPKNVVYPHSFRHFFAKCFMMKIGNIVELADLMGHSSIETTRLYTLTSSAEKRKMLNILDE